MGSVSEEARERESRSQRGRVALSIVLLVSRKITKKIKKGKFKVENKKRTSAL